VRIGDVSLVQNSTTIPKCASEVVTPSSLREDRVRSYVGDHKSWVHARWIASQEIPGRYLFPSIGLVRQSNTHTSSVQSQFSSISYARKSLTYIFGFFPSSLFNGKCYFDLASGSWVWADLGLQLHWENWLLLNTLSWIPRDRRLFLEDFTRKTPVSRSWRWYGGTTRETKKEKLFLTVRPCSIGNDGSRPLDVIWLVCMYVIMYTLRDNRQISRLIGLIRELLQSRLQYPKQSDGRLTGPGLLPGFYTDSKN